MFVQDLRDAQTGRKIPKFHQRGRCIALPLRDLRNGVREINGGHDTRCGVACAREARNMPECAAVEAG